MAAVEQAWPLATTEEAAEAALIARLRAAPPAGSQAPAFSRRQEVLPRTEAVDTEVLNVARLARKALDKGEVKPDLDGEKLVETVAERGMDCVNRTKFRQLTNEIKVGRKK